MSDSISGMIADLERSGAKRRLPDRQPGQYTLGELAAEGHFGRDNKALMKAIRRLVESGEWGMQEAIIRTPGKRPAHTVVYWQIK